MQDTTKRSLWDKLAITFSVALTIFLVVTVIGVAVDYWKSKQPDNGMYFCVLTMTVGEQTFSTVRLDVQNCGQSQVFRAEVEKK